MNISKQVIARRKRVKKLKGIDLFLERRAAMHHAIRVLREGEGSLDRVDADTLNTWLNELQAAQS